MWSLRASLGLALIAAWFLDVRAEVDFRSEIQPILEQNCYECHGPKERKGGLRLTNRTEAFEPGDYGVPVIVPGSSEASILVDLIGSKDPAERMPRDREALKPEQIELIRRWIDTGAEWPESAGPAVHWAYLPPARPTPPATRGSTWPRRDLDRFVLARLEAEQIEPAPAASPEALLRRVHFDLTGLPPSPERIEEFLRAPTDQAYERIVDELLASPQFGEHWAVEWLDAARYADSTGFMSEVELSNWPYRDWVVQAINEDMPFDRFSIAQLAGDLLPNATVADRAATGFHRAAPLNLEAGVREEEARVTQVIDRANTTASVWLGTTLACAQCHDHKYDPISQEEYYRFYAFFDHTPREAVSKDGMGGVNLKPGGPTLVLPHRDETRQAAAGLADALLAEVEAGLPESFPGAPPVAEPERHAVRDAVSRMDYDGVLAAAGNLLIRRLAAQQDASWWGTSRPWFEPWFEETQRRIRSGEPKWSVLEVRSFASTETGETSYRVLEDGSILVKGDPPDWATYTVEVTSSLPRITGLRLTAMRDESLPGGGPGRRNPVQSDFTLSEIRIAEQDGDRRSAVPLRHAHASASQRGGLPKFAFDGNSRTGWAYGHSRRQDRREDQWLVVVPRTPIDGSDRKVLRIELAQLAGAGSTFGRFRLEATATDPTIVAMPPRLQETVTAGSWQDIDPFAQGILLALALRDVLPDYAPAFDRAREGFDALPPPPVAHVMVEEPVRRTTRVFERGDLHVPGKEVDAATPAFLPPLPDDRPRDRLALARWLVARDNPLAARVTANRWWARIFGRGIVSTLGDFGIRGERPSHPDLLDWLAVELMDSGWSRKHLIREMVLSATYRQSVVPADPGTLVRDPANRLLARSPRLRLPAEAIRDNALQIAGLLSLKQGGPVVSPPQPEGVWRINGTEPVEYVPSKGEDLYRRGLYTVWRRTAPYPSFVNFDASNRTTCLLERRQSNTPLQALTLLNDEVYAQAALAFAERLLDELPDAEPAERFDRAFQLAVSRRPSEAEREILEKVLASRRERLAADPASVRALLEGSPHFRVSSEVDREELAAWFAVTRVLLNLDETIHRG